MKKLLIAVAILIVALIELKAQTIPDSLLIKQTVSDYIEGWYLGDTLRMSKSIHHDLAKRGIVPGRDGKSTELLQATYREMMLWTSKKPNQVKDQSIRLDEIRISLIVKGVNIAIARCESPEFIDFLHLARIKNEWKIINAIWEPNYK